MRRCLNAASVVAIVLFAGASLCRAESVWGGYSAAGEQGQCDACSGGRFGHHGGHCGHHRLEGRDRNFNCGCNGSYKYPVPPLYTYHWPGMYSAQLMTDYHSPYRFPPLKPYVDEAAPVEEPGIVEAAPGRLQPTAQSVLRTRR